MRHLYCLVLPALLGRRGRASHRNSAVHQPQPHCRRRDQRPGGRDARRILHQVRRIRRSEDLARRRFIARALRQIRPLPVRVHRPQGEEDGRAVRVQEDCEIDEYYWVSPTRLIYTIAQRQRENVRPTPTGEIFAVNRDGSRMRHAVRLSRRRAHARHAPRQAQGELCDAEFLELAEEGSERILIADIHGAISAPCGSTIRTPSL